MNKQDLERRRYEGYHQGSSGRGSQYQWDDLDHGTGSYQTYGDDARWKNSPRAEHLNNDLFGQGNRDRWWAKNLDNQRPHGHYGKGPKGYKRKDEKIYEDACEMLSHHPEVDASEIEVSVKDSIVTLTGRVESRRMKRLAEDAVDNILGVEDVVNLLWMAGESKVVTPPREQKKS